MERTENMTVEFRLLAANEIECRVGQGGNNNMTWCSLLLYKDARCDMNRLDEAFGTFGWKRSHTLVGADMFCTVSVKNPESGEWIDRMDVGTPSKTEATKGLASDAFKRACVNIGIGRELYTAPKIFVKLGADEYGKDGRLKTSFFVKSIEYTNRTVSKLEIVDNNGKIRYTFPKETKSAPKQNTTGDVSIDEMLVYALPQIEQAQDNIDLKKIWEAYPGLHEVHEFTSRMTERKLQIKKAKGVA